MKIYFLSSTPCALRFNSVYFGITDRFERFAEVSLQDKLFVEFTPQNALPIQFFLTENIRTQPPKGCVVYLLPDAIAIYAKEFPPNDYTLQIIKQERFLDNLLTLFKQGPLYLSIETEKGFFLTTLPPSFEDCTLSFSNNVFFIKSQNSLAIYNKSGKQLFLEDILEYSTEENTLNATLPLSNRFGWQKKCSYTLTEEGCFQTQTTLQQLPSLLPPHHDALIAYAFFESLLLGADYQQFLSEELTKNAQQLPAFLGNFQEIVLTDKENICGLVYEKAEALYEIVYYTIEVQEGKIVDIHP